MWRSDKIAVTGSMHRHHSVHSVAPYYAQAEVLRSYHPGGYHRISPNEAESILFPFRLFTLQTLVKVIVCILLTTTYSIHLAPMFSSIRGTLGGLFRSTTSVASSSRVTLPPSIPSFGLQARFRSHLAPRKVKYRKSQKGRPSVSVVAAVISYELCSRVVSVAAQSPL